MSEDRTERLAANEAVFRLVNEQIQGLNREVLRSTSAATIDIFCECARIACAERMAISIAAYEHVRANALFFLVRPGHELHDLEEVVEITDSYNVVEKDPTTDAGKTAIETDPRS